MEENLIKSYAQILADIAKQYNEKESPLQISLSLANTGCHFMIRGRRSRCKVILDPMGEANPLNESADTYICSTEDDVIAIINYMISHYEDFASYRPDSEDVYDQSDVSLIHNTDDLVYEDEDNNFYNYCNYCC